MGHRAARHKAPGVPSSEFAFVDRIDCPPPIQCHRTAGGYDETVQLSRDARSHIVAGPALR